MNQRKERRPSFSSKFRQSLAHTNNVNVNMLFKWRRHVNARLFDMPSPALVMLPVYAALH